MQINYLQWMFGIYTQFGLSSEYSYNKNWTIPYFINLIECPFERNILELEIQQQTTIHPLVLLV